MTREGTVRVFAGGDLGHVYESPDPCVPSGGSSDRRRLDEPSTLRWIDEIRAPYALHGAPYGPEVVEVRHDHLGAQRLPNWRPRSSRVLTVALTGIPAVQQLTNHGASSLYPLLRLRESKTSA